MKQQPSLIINGRFLTQQLTGVQRFANELLKEYLKITNENIPIILAPPNCKVEYLHGVKIKKIGYNNSHLWEQIDLPLYLIKIGSPLLLNLTNTAPIHYKNQIVTIHDLAFLHNPQWFSFGFRTYYKFLIPAIAKRAKSIITVSKFSKSEITNKLKVTPGKVTVIYNSVPSEFHYKEPNEGFKRERYALAVGSLDPRKNLAGLIRAFNTLGNTKLQLYIIGGSNSKIFNIKLPDFDSEKIKLLGRISDEELISLYANAEIFIYPTLYEGFGIPNIEAMHFSTAVITSDLPVTREVCKDAALYINPHNIEDIQRGISALEGNKELVKKLSARGKEISSSYTWKKACKKLIEVINNASQTK